MLSEAAHGQETADICGLLWSHPTGHVTDFGILGKCVLMRWRPPGSVVRMKFMEMAGRESFVCEDQPLQNAGAAFWEVGAWKL